MLSCVGNVLGDIDGIAVSTNLLVGGEKSLGSLVSGRFALSTEEVAAASTAITEGNGSLKLRTVEKRICAVTHTRWIVVALIIVREGTPFGAGINDTVSKNQTTRATDHITRRELLNEIGRILSAVLADQRHVQVLTPFLCSTLVGECIRGKHLGLIRLCAIDIVKFVKDRALALLASDLNTLLRYGRSSSEISSGFFAEEGSGDLAEEWGMRFGGIDWGTL